MVISKVEIPVTSTSYPPSRVTDLKVVAMQVYEMSLTIEWTAPGEQLDVGLGIIPRSILAICYS